MKSSKHKGGYNLEEGPPFGGEEDRAHIPVRLAPILIVLNMVETSMFPWRRSWFFVGNLERTRGGRITSGASALVVVGGFLSCFCFPLFLCFREARRSVMTFCCVFDASRNFARPC